MAALRSVTPFLLVLILFPFSGAFAQPCTALGQTPATAFPVCGTSVFQQNTVPLCVNSQALFVPGCPEQYPDRNPFYYKFTCFVSGTLGFLIAPLAGNEDYDWQLWDITGRNPNDVFNDNSLVITANWAGTYGPTGASSAGASAVQCGSDPALNRPTFAAMPQIIQGHEYLLMISHFTPGQSGYNLSFTGGTGVITDPTEPHMLNVKPDCDGTTLRLKVNKKIKCNSLTATGSEFSIFPAVTTVVSAITTTCTSSFEFDEVTITLANPLPNGNYQLVINKGTDLNSLLDNCGRNIPDAEQVPFFYAVPQPIFADSIGRPGCAPSEVTIYFPKRITCTSIAADGSDFTVAGPSPVTVIRAAGNCNNDLSDYITIKFASPVYNKGQYFVTLRAGTDGSTIIDECNIAMPQQTLSFMAVDSVSADFSYTEQLGCRQNTLAFSHNGAHDVNKWSWTFNDNIHVSTQTHTIIFPATSNNTVQLIVTNGVCSDTVSKPVVMDNEVKAGFIMPDVICPEDLLICKDTSAGLIDSWQWSFGNIAASADQDPVAVQFPQNNIESFYMVKLKVTNNALGCTDSVSKRLRVLNNCFIAVPTAFTPDGDGLNDFLYPNNALKAKDLEFKVYNRWGQLVFSTRNWQEKWNGKINGLQQGSGVYVWFLRYTHTTTGKKIFQKGTTTLIR